jgi:hypothetical protein
VGAAADGSSGARFPNRTNRVVRPNLGETVGIVFETVKRDFVNFLAHDQHRSNLDLETFREMLYAL